MGDQHGDQIGFVGLGIMGQGMVRNLLKKRTHSLLVWNRDRSKCEALAAEFSDRVSIAATPKDVVRFTKVTYSMLSTLEASEDVFEGEHGVLAGVVAAAADGKKPCIIDCATLTPERMMEMSEAVVSHGGRFVEAPVSGSKGPAEQGTLVFMTAGDRELYDSVCDDLDAMGKSRHFLGDVGAASRMKIVVNMVMGGMLACFAEGMSLARSSDLPVSELMAILDQGAMSCALFKTKGPSMAKGEYPPSFPLKHAQKDMRFAVDLGDKVCAPLPVSSAANEVYKKARQMGLGDQDFSAVLEALIKGGHNGHAY